MAGTAEVEGFELATALADRISTNEKGEAVLLFFTREAAASAIQALGFDLTLSRTTSPKTSETGGLFHFRMKACNDDPLALVSELEALVPLEKAGLLKNQFDAAKRNKKNRSQKKLGSLEASVYASATTQDHPLRVPHCKRVKCD
jgi:hypothetical protein